MSEPTESIPNYSEDTSVAFHEVLQQFNPKYVHALHKQHKDAYFENLLAIIRSETGQDSISWPEAIFDITADRICRAAVVTVV